MSNSNRIRFISILVFIFAIVIMAKLYMLQIVDHDIYVDKADRQYTSPSGKLFSRGTIYFQNKDGTLVSGASLKSGFIVAINPTELSDAESVYKNLSPIISIDHDTFMSKASKSGDPYEEIAKQVDQDTGQKVKDLNIKGLNVYKERWRFYPGGQTAGGVLGLLGYQGDEYAGRYGLEKQYDSILQRPDTAYVNFFAQIFSNINLGQSSESATGDIVTTIEPTVQAELENLLASTSQLWSPDYIGGIILNPKNGEIYAMALYPSFDPNSPQSQKSSAIFSNKLVEDSYEMGSIIKPLTVSAGIDAGVITATSTYYDNGFVIVNGKKISNFDSKQRGVVTIQEALSQSLNVGMSHIVSLLGNQKFTDYMYDFGVSEKTGIDLPNESRNLTDTLKSNRDIEHFTASFGQGISLSPINTARVLSSIANGGMLIYPHVVSKINYRIGTSKTVELPPSRRVMKQSTAEEVSRMMVWSVDNVLANGKDKLDHYSVAAKTGTAQVVENGAYSSDKFLHSFVGFFPAYDSKFFIFLYMMNPKGAQFSSETLTTPFSRMVNFLVNYYELPPDR